MAWQVIIDTADNGGDGSDSSVLAARDDAAGNPSTSYEDFNQLYTEHCKRRNDLARIDPVHTIALRQFLGKALFEFQRVTPAETLTQLMKNMSQDAKNMVQDITSTMTVWDYKLSPSENTVKCNVV